MEQNPYTLDRLQALVDDRNLKRQYFKASLKEHIIHHQILLLVYEMAVTARKGDEQ